jgi:hypothetical protein
VTGELTRVFRAPHGQATTGDETDYVVELRSPDLPVQFLCAARDRKTLAKLDVGQTVTIRAFCCGRVPGAFPAAGDKERSAASLHFYGYEIEIKPRGKRVRR